MKRCLLKRSFPWCNSIAWHPWTALERNYIESNKILYASMKNESESYSVVSNSLQPHGLYSPWNSPGQNTGVGCHALLQGIFPTQGSNPGLPHYRQILYLLSHKGSPICIYTILISIKKKKLKLQTSFIVANLYESLLHILLLVYLRLIVLRKA